MTDLEDGVRELDRIYDDIVRISEYIDKLRKGLAEANEMLDILAKDVHFILYDGGAIKREWLDHIE